MHKAGFGDLSIWEGLLLTRFMSGDLHQNDTADELIMDKRMMRLGGQTGILNKL